MSLQARALEVSRKVNQNEIPITPYVQELKEGNDLRAQLTFIDNKEWIPYLSELF